MLIRKYLNGELDALAMHQLERRAQSDPFLMDALEGYGHSGADSQPQLDELSKRLQQRVESRPARVIPFRVIAIAASILVLFTVGWLWLANNKNTPPPKMAAIVKPEIRARLNVPVAMVPKTDSSTLAVIPAAPQKAIVNSTDKKPIVSPKNATANLVADNIFASNRNSDAKTDTAKSTPMDEMVVMGMEAKKKDVIAKTDTGISRQLQGRVAGVAVKESIFSAPGNGRIRGRIIGKDDGMPLTGVSVKIQGKAAGTLTDENGYFSLPADSSKAKLLIAYIGYQPIKLTASNRDSLKTIAMVPNIGSLSEVVVSGYSSKSNDDYAVDKDARPQDGWVSFKKYLKEKAISPDGKSGIVKLSFMVSNSGNISDIKVIKGLSPLTDQKAVDLINSGPDWAASTSGKPEKIILKIKFGK